MAMENKVLILGAGMVAQPIIRYLLNEGIFVTVASNTPERAVEMVNNHINGKVVNWSVDDEKALDNMIKEHDVVVSLLPFTFHLIVARYALKNKKNMITSSYSKPEMLALNQQAKDAGIIILNELGLDPGIDHMSAMRIIDHIHGKGGKVEEFYSICGALPAPECANNPFGYKFSWSPKGVIMAGNNDAKYLKKGDIINTPTANLFKDKFSLKIPKIGELEVYPNRDSLSYIDIYGIPEAKTMYRGTFRYKGWCEALDVIKRLNLVTSEKHDFTGKTYAQMVAMMIHSDSTDNLKTQVAKYLNINVTSTALNAIEWLGLFENTPMNRNQDSTFEITSDLMIEKMDLKPNERDMVILQHIFTASYPDGKQEVIKSSMLDFGTPATDTSIARTVALPAAIGVKMILEKKITLKGVFIPVLPEIYNPILEELKKLNISLIEEFGLPMSESIQ